MERVLRNALAKAPRLCRLIFALSATISHRSELSTASLRPDWHFQDKPIHTYPAKNIGILA